MALTLDAENAGIITLDEYVEHIETAVDVDDLDSLIESAPALRALTNNRNLIADVIDRELRNWRDFQRGNEYTGQSLMLARRDRFYVRANIWAPPAKAADGIRKPVAAPYILLHDHNFTFLTAGYAGPGYSTDLYEVDPARIEGFEGEIVEIRHTERAMLDEGKVMLYRAGRDVHIQHFPQAVSVSINLIVPGEAAYGPQFYFEVSRDPSADRGTIVQRCDNEFGRSIGLCELARRVGGPRTAELLDGLAATSANPQVRRVAAEARDALIGRES